MIHAYDQHTWESWNNLYFLNKACKTSGTCFAYTNPWMYYMKCFCAFPFKRIVIIEWILQTILIRNCSYMNDIDNNIDIYLIYALIRICIIMSSCSHAGQHAIKRSIASMPAWSLIDHCLWAYNDSILSKNWMVYFNHGDFPIFLLLFSFNVNDFFNAQHFSLLQRCIAH